MTRPTPAPSPRMTAAKTFAAALGSVLTVVSVALADNVFDAGDAAEIAAAVVPLALTVYAVWRTPNRPA